MRMSNQAQHYVFDIEVFKYGSLVSFKNIETGEFDDFILAPNRQNDLREWMDSQELLLCGFNNKHYDNYILNALYHQFNYEDIKELNDWIIGGNQGWEWSKWNYHKQTFEAYDIKDDLPITLSLKEIEGNMGLPIIESSIPFDLDRELTLDEWDEVIEYCHYDIEATDKLRKERKAYLESKVYVGQLAGLTEGQALSMTNAKLTAAYLVGKSAKPKKWGDDTDYVLPDNVEVKNQEILDFYKVIDPKYEARLVTTIAGVEHTLAYGGLHGARPNYIGETTDDRVIVNIDVVSYYPSLMIKNGYVSRAVPTPSDYNKVYKRRIIAKSEGNKDEANGLKLVLNTTYGAMKNQYNPLYDALMANSVCISGQLYLIDLIEKLEEVPTFELIQSNTDGIMIAVDRKHFEHMDFVVRRWEHLTGFTMEFDDVQSIYQKDVNNYVMVSTKGDIKVKGGYVSNYEGGSINNASIPIVAKAIVKYLVHHKPVEDTINEVDEILEFQMIAKTGRTYDKTVHEVNGDLIEVQRVNRVYATTNESYGTLYKIKEDGRKDKIANLPDHCIIDNHNDLTINDIDTQFYIDMAHKRIQDFIGDQPMINKKEESHMTTKKVTPTIAKDDIQPIGLFAKLFELRKVLASFVWEKDGKNLQQKYKYITEAQYKKYFQKALEQVELDYFVDITEMEFTPNITDKMHLTSIKAIFTIFDPITGEGRSYTSFGQGADMHDKGIYKAMTGCLKYFIANNFLVNDGSDPENDEDDVKPKAKYVEPSKREEIKKEIMETVEAVTQAQKDRIKELRDLIKGSGQHADVVKKVNTTMKASPSKVQANALIMELEDIVEDLENE